LSASICGSSAVPMTVAAAADMPKVPQSQKRKAEIIGDAVHVMRISVVAVLGLTSFAALGDEFPIKDAETAVSIAKHVCEDKANPSLTWRTHLDSSGKVLSAMTSIKKSGKSALGGEYSGCWTSPD
jgi:hypothetical protein